MIENECKTPYGWKDVWCLFNVNEHLSGLTHNLSNLTKEIRWSSWTSYKHVKYIEFKRVKATLNEFFASVFTRILEVTDLQSFSCWSIYFFINTFLVNVPILYLLKTPESLWFSSVFRGYEMGTLAWNWLILVWGNVEQEYTLFGQFWHTVLITCPLFSIHKCT